MQRNARIESKSILVLLSGVHLWGVGAFPPLAEPSPPPPPCDYVCYSIMFCKCIVTKISGLRMHQK